MPLNPDKNLFAVAPVGNAIVIGRAMALKGGMERGHVLNLIGWLIIATDAKKEEIAQVLIDALRPTVQVTTINGSVSGNVDGLAIARGNPISPEHLQAIRQALAEKGQSLPPNMHYTQNPVITGAVETDKTLDSWIKPTEEEKL